MIPVPEPLQTKEKGQTKVRAGIGACAIFELGLFTIKPNIERDAQFMPKLSDLLFASGTILDVSVNLSRYF